MSEILSKKKIIALIIVIAIVAVVAFLLVSGDDTDEIKGAEVQMYLTTLPQNIDPSAAYTSAEQIRIMGLIYEGLTTINADGELELALCSDYEYEFDQRTGNLNLFITLENSRWSDGNMVTSDDFRFAWKRILLPLSDNENAALLYPVLNARNVKEGLCSQDDLGVYAPQSNLLQITFEKSFCNEYDYTDAEIESKIEYFLRRLSSPALVPLRQDVVDEDTKTWCSPNGTSYVTNGPFKIRNWHAGELTFERNINYRCVGDNDGADDAVVTPFQLITLYSEGRNATEHYERFKKDKCFFLNLINADEKTRKAVKDDMQTDKLVSTTCVYLDTTHELFANPKVRQALSLAIDRKAAAKEAYALPATGFVPSGVETAVEDGDFRVDGGTLIKSTPNIELAKQILAEEGIVPTEYVIAIDYSNEVPADAALANKCVEAWKAIGFRITTANAKTQKFIASKESGEYPMNQTYESGQAVAIIVNLQSVTPDAYSILTSFSSEYGGHSLDITQEETTYGAHVTGFKDAKYDELCGNFVNVTTEGMRNVAMHSAEKYLVEQMPAIPLVFNTTHYVTKDLDNFETDSYGRLNFTELEQDNFEDYIETDKKKK